MIVTETINIDKAIHAAENTTADVTVVRLADLITGTHAPVMIIAVDTIVRPVVVTVGMFVPGIITVVTAIAQCADTMDGVDEVFMMKNLLMMLNLMAFMALCMVGFVKSGAGEALVKQAAKGVVTEIVKEEIQKQLPEMPSVKKPDNWWNRS